MLKSIRDIKKCTITTLGSHCALQVLKGAKDEGFNTLLLCEKKREKLYKRFKFIDEIILLDKFEDFQNNEIQQELLDKNTIIIPHGTLISSLDIDAIENIKLPIFGNKYILKWESDRILKQKLIDQSGLSVPKEIKNKNEIKKLSIVKLHGAAGGKGYFLAWDKKSYDDGFRKLKNQKIIKSERELYIQEYIFGVPVYLQFFYSPISNEIELLGIDRRYESDIDGISRIPANAQIKSPPNPTYTVIGNLPLVLRESLLLEAYEMAEKFVDTTKRLVKHEMSGPFCLEGVYDKEGKFTIFEFSGRIVAGTNLFINGSPYSDLIYDKPMSSGRRIAREIKISIQKNKLDKVVT
ncbi:MAG: DUF1297 domain-containing protein [Nitrososphaeraceae archaeon]